MPYPYVSGINVVELGTLTAVGVTDAQPAYGDPQTLQLVVSGLGTDAVVRLEGSLNDTDYFPMRDETGMDFTLTANGSYGYTIYGPVVLMRLRLVSFTGGTPSISGWVAAA